jgi:hypothetical protein
MIDVELHFQGSGTQRQRLPALPRQGDYLTHEGKVWRCDSVVWTEASATWGHGRIDVYVLGVAADLQDALEQVWAAWSLKDE